MRYFVKIQDGRVVSQPAVISDERTASPNTMWSPGQMALNDMVEVDIECGPQEIIDLDHPHLADGHVTYDRLPKPPKTQEELAREQTLKYEADQEILIQAKIRALAIEKLKTEGKLDASGAITASGKESVEALKTTETVKPK